MFAIFNTSWAGFQQWLRKWNKIMSIVFSVLVILLLLAILLVNLFIERPISIDGQARQKSSPIEDRYIDIAFSH